MAFFNIFREGNSKFKILVESKGQIIKKEVYGYVITPGLGIYYNRSQKRWEIHHLPSCTFITSMPNKEKAFSLIEHIKDILKWENALVPELLKQKGRVQQYLMHVREAILNDKDVPSVPDSIIAAGPILSHPELILRAEYFIYAYESLMNLVGLEELKGQIMKFVDEIRGELILREKGYDLSKKESMHMVFLGPPGTGKTTVARIMGNFLYSLGKLKTNKVVETDRSGLVGQHLGHSETKTREVIDRARGGILFIDEAYALQVEGIGHDFGQEVVNVLIKAMEDYRDELVVIFAGYQTEMQKFLEMNPGMESRIKYRFTFRSYLPKELSEIVRRELVSQGFDCPEETVREIEKAMLQIDTSGNGRSARSFCENIIREYKIRIGKQGKEQFSPVILPEDMKNALPVRFDLLLNTPGLVELQQEALRELDQLIGLEEMKEEVRNLMNYIKANLIRMQHAGNGFYRPTLHMAFYGPPGTGKTTVARIMGKFLKGLGLLRTGVFVEADRAKLIAKWVGHTARNVKDVFESAKGGVLFIDEAYSLRREREVPGHDFGAEAVDTLIKLMEDYRHDICVILAGYKDEMEKFFDSNPGFRSRINYYINFPYYKPDELAKITKMYFEKEKFHVEQDAYEKIQEFIEEVCQNNGGKIEGNARWARNLYEKILVAQSNRIVNEKNPDTQKIIFNDVEEGIRIFIKTRNMIMS